MIFPYIKKLGIKIVQNTVKMSRQNFCSDARIIFEAAYKSVQPENLIAKAVQVNATSIQIQGATFELSKNVHMVGFGKAVLGMATILEKKLKEHLVSGILSIPEGMKASFDTKQSESCIEVYEGASKNIPDDNAFLAASKIKELVISLKESDILLVLISGGGSALLPAPKPPLTLEEKKKVTSLLASKGATIEELNTVRRRLSLLKGGNLALLAKPAKVISLILSDIIGDPLGLIASGPTVQNTDDPKLVWTIVEKYDLKKELPPPAIELLKEIPTKSEEADFSHVKNFIIGNNETALAAAFQTATDLDYQPIIMSKNIRGMANSIGRNLVSLVVAALQHEYEDVRWICNELKLNSESKRALLNSIDELQNKNGKKICLLFGGETTVEVRGKGLGGRNQELSLSAALELHSKKPKNNIVLLSAGTDGIDGPTQAAGAIATTSTIEIAKKEGLDPGNFLMNNNSNAFFSKANKGSWLVETGHTGTNVMDIIVILIS